MMSNSERVMKISSKVKPRRRLLARRLNPASFTFLDSLPVLVVFLMIFRMGSYPNNAE
jgi:hypothetical protein